MPSDPDSRELPLPDLKTTDSERSAEYTSFLKYVAQSTGCISYEQLSILYPAICQSAMEWLLRDKKSVDMGFCVLHPMPHRANWKQILIALFPTLGPTLLGKTKAQKTDLMTSTGFFNKMFSGEMLAVGVERYVMWGIEVELRRSWWRAMFRQEAYKFAQLGSVEYAAYVARQILKLRTKLTNVYLSWLRQISYPCAKIQSSRVHRRGYIVPLVPKGKVRPVADNEIPVSIVVPRSPEELVAPGLAALLPTDAGLPKVRDFRQESGDLRVGEAIVPKR